MNSYPLLSCFVILAIVSCVRANAAYHKFLNAVPEDVQTECAAEADLTAEKDKILADETLVDQDKLSCYTACVLKHSGAMKDGNVSFDVISKQMDAFLAGDPNLQMRKDIVKNCIGQISGSNDCEKISSMAKCILKVAAEKSL